MKKIFTLILAMLTAMSFAASAQQGKSKKNREAGSANHIVSTNTATTKKGNSRSTGSAGGSSAGGKLSSSGSSSSSASSSASGGIFGHTADSGGLKWNPSTRTFTYGSYTYRFVEVEGGSYTMGKATGGDFDESPVHTVRLSKFYIGTTEVPQWLWRAVMGSNPSNTIGDTNPVEQVSWNDCQTFISKLNRLTGASFRLPTEAQWEFAARGGNSSRGYRFAGGNSAQDVAWFTDNSGVKTHPVAVKRANELGLYDMSGNVQEWCSDWRGVYQSGTQTDPTGPTSGEYRVSRGGDYMDRVDNLTVTHRGLASPDDHYSFFGLRLAIY